MHPYFNVRLNTEEIDRLTEDEKLAFIKEAQMSESVALQCIALQCMMVHRMTVHRMTVHRMMVHRMMVGCPLPTAHCPLLTPLSRLSQTL